MPPPHQEPVTQDPTSVAFVDGLSCTTCDDNVIVYGGSAADRVWRLHLPSATWTEVPCVGTVPPPRFFHAASYCSGYLTMCGGELIVSEQYTHPARLNYYELNLETFEWSCLDTFDDVPLNRSHHTMTSLHGGKEMVVFGGKPIPAGSPQGNLANRVLTSRQFHEMRSSGFYDVFILYPMSRTWKRIEMFDPLSPVMWGHSASLYNTSHILFFGGCDVAQSDWRSVGAATTSGGGATNASGAYYTSDEPPVASLSNTVHILTLETWQWQQYDIPPKDAGPVPRALHVSESCCDELIVFGGFTINRFGAVVTTTDCWMWSVRRGSWQRIEFCVPQWSSKKLLSCVYGTQWIVMSSLDTVFFMEMSKIQLGWQRAGTKVQRLLAAPSDRAGMVRRALPSHNGGAGGLFPPHLYVASPSKSLDPEETPFHYKSPHPSSRPLKGSDGAEQDHHNDDVYDYIASLRDEVNHLRQELTFTTSVADTVHTVEFTQPRSDAAMRGKLMRWDMYSTPSDSKGGNQHPESLRMETRTASPVRGWNRSKPSTGTDAAVAPAPQGVAAAANGTSPAQAAVVVASHGKKDSASHRSPKESSTPPYPHPANAAGSRAEAAAVSNDDDDERSSTASTPSEAAAALHPRFVDRRVMDKAAKRKLEVFRKLQAKAERNVRETEHALKMFGKLEQHEANNALSSNGPRTSPRPVRDTPASSDSEENEDIHRAAELGLQLHRAMMNNTESRRQLLFRERKRRIEQLQDRLRTLEAVAGDSTRHHHHHHAGRSASGEGGGTGTGNSPGGSPDVKTFVGMAMRHSETIQRMMEAHDLGELYEDVAGGGGGRSAASHKFSANSSLVVMVPNTHAPPSLRSSSCSSLTSNASDLPRQRPIADGAGEFDAQPVEQQSFYDHQEVNVHQKQFMDAPPEIIISSSSAAIGLLRRDSMLSDVSRVSRQDSLASESRGPRALAAQTHLTVVQQPDSANIDTTSAGVSAPPAAVFRGFQRQRSKTAVQNNGGGHSPATQRTPDLPPGAPIRTINRVTGDNAGASSQPLGGAAPDQEVSITQSETLPPMPVFEPPPPTNATLQTQWDVLQAALMSRGSAAPRRAYTASENI